MSIILALEMNQEQAKTSHWKLTVEGRRHREKEQSLGGRKVYSGCIKETASLEVSI